MGIPTEKKDTANWQMIGGLDRVSLEAQELMFDGDHLAVSYVDKASFYPDQRFDYTSGNLDYKGFNETHKAATDATSWVVWKYTWSSGNLVRIEGPLTGSWDGRASLSWGS